MEIWRRIYKHYKPVSRSEGCPKGRLRKPPPESRDTWETKLVSFLFGRGRLLVRSFVGSLFLRLGDRFGRLRFGFRFFGRLRLRLDLGWNCGWWGRRNCGFPLLAFRTRLPCRLGGGQSTFGCGFGSTSAPGSG